MTEVLQLPRNSIDAHTTSEDELEDPEKKPETESLPKKDGNIQDTLKTEDTSKEELSNVVLEDKGLSSAFFPSLNHLPKDINVKQNYHSQHQKEEFEREVILALSKQNSEAGSSKERETIEQSKSESPKPGPSNYVPPSKKRKLKRSVGSFEAPFNQETPELNHHNTPYSVKLNPNYLNAHPLWDMIINFPKAIANDFQKFHATMCLWRWHKLDGCDLIVVKRPNMELIPASIVQVKMLSKFASNIVQNIPENALPKMVSYKMTPAEAWMLNFINASVGGFNMGLQIFVNGDDLVEVSAVEKYYWTVKKVHLEQLLMIYSGELPPGSIFENKNLVGGIINLKKMLVEEIKKTTFKQIELSF